MKKIISSVGLMALVVAFATVASAATTVVVTPSNTEGWSTADTRPGGTVEIVAATSSPFGDAALQLTTNVSTTASSTAKAQYLHGATTTLAEVTDLSYYTLQAEGPIHADASYQLLVDLNGATTGGFTTFVFEPYQNGTVTPSVWQQWDVDAGQLWSTRGFTEGTCTVVSGGGGAPFYTLTDLKANCPDAVVLGFGVNIGSNNPGYDVYTDGVVFNDTTYDFELDASEPEAPTSKDECKNGGWMSFTNPTFKNQGQCVSSVANNK